MAIAKITAQAQAPVPQTPSYRTIIRRGTTEERRYTPILQPYGANTLFKGATQTSSSEYIPFLDRDVHHNVNNYGRRTLMTLGRYLYGNFDVIGGTIREQATLTSENFQPQFTGEDQAWGEQAEAALLEWEKSCDISGGVFDFASIRELGVIHAVRDGDFGVLLTEDLNGWPLLQTWEGHRIGDGLQGLSDGLVKGGPFDGARICEGIILNDYRRPIGYRLLDEGGNVIGDIPARDFILTYEPEWFTQVRGFSGLASALFNWKRVRDSRDFELLAQQAASAIALLEQNETGRFNPNSSLLVTAQTAQSDGTKATHAIEKLEGGMYRYFKAGSGSGLSAFSYNRPGAQSMEFQEKILRDAFRGLDWDKAFGLAPNEAGGAALRIIVERINRVIRKRQRMIARLCRRVHGYVVSKLIKLEVLPSSDEWYKWDYQLSAEVTADRKYDSDIAVQEIGANLTTLKREAARRGSYWEDVQDQRIREKFRQIQRANEIGKEMGMDDEAIARVSGEPQEAETQPNRTPREPQTDDNEDTAD